MSEAKTEFTRPHSEIDISSWAFWVKGFEERDADFALLRNEPTPTWHESMDPENPYGEKGFWAVTRADDIAHVSKKPDVFASGVTGNVAVEPIAPESGRDTSFFLAMDPPEHTLYRRLVSAAFTVKNVRKLQNKIAADAQSIVDEFVGSGEVDFVRACSAQLPMRTVSDLLGIPESEREAITAAAENMFRCSDPDEDIEDRAGYVREQITFLHQAAVDVARHRREHPTDDLMSSIVHAEVDGQRLTDHEIGAFMVLLSTAGNDTTKQTTSHSLLALSRFPEQRRWLAEDYEARIGSAVEEFVRYASPVMSFARIATEDTVLNGAEIRAGEKVALFYCSGNRDESRFQQPHEFILNRHPNPHVGFGGGGVHFCLGNQIAKLQLREIFRQVLTKAGHIEVGEPKYMTSRVVHAIKELPVRI